MVRARRAGRVRRAKSGYASTDEELRNYYQQLENDIGFDD